mgnify:CR=1 FL=1
MTTVNIVLAAPGCPKLAQDQKQKIAKNPVPQIGIQEFGDSAVCIGFRFWVPTDKFFQSLYTVNLAVYKALQGAGIRMPYPQRDVRIVSAPAPGPENFTASQNK